jgi:D-alanyl-D-alanine carboxypeptidase
MSYVEPINNPFVNVSWKDYLKKYVSGRKAIFNCGEKHNYCNTNYLLLGLIIENTTGQNLGDAMHTILLAPYGLSETYYKSSPNYPNVKGVTENYFSQFNGYIQNGTKYQQHFANISIGHEGIIASPRDYVLFMNKLINNEILKPETMQMMIDFSESKYGMGIINEKYDNGYVIGHTGGGFGTMTFLFHIKQTNTTVFYASNIGSHFITEMSENFYDNLLNDLILILEK